MTLQELFACTPQAKKVNRVPSVAKLVTEATPVVSDVMDESNIITVYDNGYVLYQKDQWTTVFPLHECTDYVYEDNEKQQVVPLSEFLDQPWQVRVLMEGYDRMAHNCARRKEGRAVSIDIDNNEPGWIELSDMGAGDALRILIERESQQEEKELLYQNLAKLTDHQREILILCVVQGKTRMEVAKIYGTSHQAITDSLKKSIRRLRKLYGVNESCFM